MEGGSHSQRRAAAREGGCRREERERLARSEVVAVSVEDEAGGGPSLDLGENNSTSAEAGESGRYDCRRVYSNFEFESSDGEIAPYRCGSWECYCCGYRMRQNLVEEIERVTSERPELSRLMTLTLDPAKAPGDRERQHFYITERWNALRTAITREIGSFSYVWVREEQDSGLPHMHILVSRYLPQEWLSRRWSSVGGGEVVDIRQIDRVDRAAHYIGKYLTKSALSGFPKGIRRYGSSQDIRLEVRGCNREERVGDWELVMDDLQVSAVGTDLPLRRGVTGWDHVVQRRWGGPKPPPEGKLMSKGG